jgi:hypothetical protein
MLDLIGKHDALVPQMDALQEQIKEAGVAGDTAKLAELMPQFDKIQTDMQLLTATVEQLGGTTKPSAELETEAQTQLAQANKQVAAAQKALAKASELGEWGQIPKLSAKLDAARQNVTAVQEKSQQQLQMRQVAETPKGETPGLFDKPPEQPEQQAKVQETLQAEAERGLYGPESKAESAKQAFVEAEVGPRGQLEAAPVVQKVKKDKDTLALFGKENLVKTTLANRDFENGPYVPRNLDEQGQRRVEDERVLRLLEDRFGLGGEDKITEGPFKGETTRSVQSTRMYEHPMFKPTMEKIQQHKDRVEKKQRNAKECQKGARKDKGCHKGKAAGKP